MELAKNYVILTDVLYLGQRFNCEVVPVNAKASARDTVASFPGAWLDEVGEAEGSRAAYISSCF